MLLGEPELDPRAERHVEGSHNLGGDAFVDELVVADSHAFHRCAIALETPKLREVDPEVCHHTPHAIVLGTLLHKSLHARVEISLGLDILSFD